MLHEREQPGRMNHKGLQLLSILFWGKKEKACATKASRKRKEGGKRSLKGVARGRGGDCEVPQHN